MARVHRGDAGQGENPGPAGNKKSGTSASRTSHVERYLARNGTVILKFFLNISREEQRKRFLERLDEPAKNWNSRWPTSPSAHLAQYMAAYQDMIRHTSTAAAPWHVVPADHKWFARVVIA